MTNRITSAGYKMLVEAGAHINPNEAVKIVDDKAYPAVDKIVNGFRGLATLRPIYTWDFSGTFHMGSTPIKATLGLYYTYRTYGDQTRIISQSIHPDGNLCLTTSGFNMPDHAQAWLGRSGGPTPDRPTYYSISAKCEPTVDPKPRATTLPSHELHFVVNGVDVAATINGLLLYIEDLETRLNGDKPVAADEEPAREVVLAKRLLDKLKSVRS